ncbi:MAG: hypothetical protein E7660_07880, partial [Ruminococcaceae bacterium]|nr:hypothetical protein [Oscillospiraceae bacterium]
VNYDTPACMDGVCYYCGGFVAGLGHENGAWAPCMKGECSYGCGLEYPATAEHEDNEGDGYCDVCWSHLNHTFENGFDPCLGGECSVCWTFVEGKHEYFYPCDPVCINCYEITNPDAAHSVIHVEAKEPTCLESGNIEYWYCEFCGATWLDAECTLNTNLKAIMLPSPNPVIIHVEAKAPTCTENGNIEYWYCELCGYAWLDAECTLNTNLKAVILPAEHTFANPCDTYCVVCEEDVRDPNHTLTYVPCVEPVDCQTPGNIEHWYCEVCEGYFNDENGVNQLNPWYIPITADCVRPEGSADCASVNCLVCGEEIYGYGDHDLGESFPCQGGTCLKCGQKIEGYGCANYDTPACMDGVCYYCGGFVAGLGHENGAWAPCMKGECSYGCGLEYPATAEHVDNEGDGYCDTCWSHLNHTFENGFDPCYGGECSICWTFVAGEHDFEDEFTVDKAPTEEETGLESRHCKNCEAVTDETEIPTIMRGDVNGDGEVTAKDSIAIKKYIKGITDDISFYNADMNGDDEISAKDSNLLKKYLSSF